MISRARNATFHYDHLSGPCAGRGYANVLMPQLAQCGVSCVDGGNRSRTPLACGSAAFVAPGAECFSRDPEWPQSCSDLTKSCRAARSDQSFRPRTNVAPGGLTGCPRTRLMARPSRLGDCRRAIEYAALCHCDPVAQITRCLLSNGEAPNGSHLGCPESSRITVGATSLHRPMPGDRPRT